MSAPPSSISADLRDVEGSKGGTVLPVSSPNYASNDSNIRPHADYLDPADSWLDRPMSVDVEATAEEFAVIRLRAGLDALGDDGLVGGASRG